MRAEEYFKLGVLYFALTERDEGAGFAVQKLVASPEIDPPGEEAALLKAFELAWRRGEVLGEPPLPIIARLISRLAIRDIVITEAVKKLDRLRALAEVLEDPKELEKLRTKLAESDRRLDRFKAKEHAIVQDEIAAAYKAARTPLQLKTVESARLQLAQKVAQEAGPDRAAFFKAPPGAASPAVNFRKSLQRYLNPSPAPVGNPPK
jgi:hypothetical protein